MTIEQLKENRKQQIIQSEIERKEMLIEEIKNLVGLCYENITKFNINSETSVSIWFKDHKEIIITPYEAYYKFFIRTRFGSVYQYSNFADALIRAEISQKELNKKWWQFWK